MASVLLLATSLVAQFPTCFWFGRPDARPESTDDVRLVVQNLRKFGNREAWMAAQHLVACLQNAGFDVARAPRLDEWTRDATFRTARVRSAAGEVLAIDRAADSAFRFFPIVPDPLLGWRLHHFDAATNKALTLAARTEDATVCPRGPDRASNNSGALARPRRAERDVAPYQR